jgi:hypothetical protein
MKIIYPLEILFFIKNLHKYINYKNNILALINKKNRFIKKK